jgi:hypothetical protein
MMDSQQPKTSTQQSPKSEMARRLQANAKEAVAESLAMVVPGTSSSWAVAGTEQDP